MRELSKKLEMILNEKNKAILIFLLLIIILSCSSIKNNNPNRLIIKIQDIYKQDSLEYGEIIYKSPTMDTLKLGEKDKRYLWFHFGIYDKPHNINDLKGKTTESYKAINDSVIPFDSKYNKSGIYYLEGYIEEVFLLPEYDENGNMRKIDNFIKVSKKIEIVDK